MQYIIFALISVSLFGCGVFNFGCELKVGDSFHYNALIEKLDAHNIKYQQIGKQAISYSCESALDVKQIEKSLLAYYYPDCGARFSDVQKQSMFISSLESAGIEYWVVTTDDGEKVNCNSKDKERARDLAQQIFFQH